MVKISDIKHIMNIINDLEKNHVESYLPKYLQLSIFSLIRTNI